LHVFTGNMINQHKVSIFISRTEIGFNYFSHDKLFIIQATQSPKMNPFTLDIEDSWKKQLANEWQQVYFAELLQFLELESKNNHTVYPPQKQIFAAFENTPFERVKVVIIGQDPYHGEGQANGLCFSVAPNVRIPPSLNNIFKELNRDVGISKPTNGDLSAWTKQGVLLLNATLTVRANEPGSHQKKGWEQFTDAVIKEISENKEHVVFMLWGNYAKKKGEIINRNKHLVLEAAHPSPLARSGFSGCAHFSLANEYLAKNNIQSINWRL
jgi:uracil-DNA glycosylase